MASIGAKLAEWSNDSLIKLKNILLECTEEVMRYLEEKFSYRNNFFVIPNDYQLISYIATILKLRYDITGDGSINCQKKDELKIRTALTSIECDVLLNIFENNWSNAGDTKLDNSIGMGSKDSGLKYLKLPNKNDVVTSFDMYMRRQNEMESFAGGVKSVDKMLLAYLLNKEIEKNGNILEAQMKLDVEHIVTKEILKQNGIKLISPLCNLCFLPPYENRGKKEKIIYDFIDDRKLYNIDEVKLERFTYPSKEELKEVLNNKFELTMKIYKNFLTERKNKLKIIFERSLPSKLS